MTALYLQTHLFISLSFQVETEQQEASPTEEEQLLAALRMKADAFANKDWEAYWLREGPSLLTNGWLVTRPNIPLAKVEEVCSLDFISSAIESLRLDEHQGHDSYSTESIVSLSAGDKGTKTSTEGQGLQVDSEMDLSSAHDHEKGATVTAEISREGTTTTFVSNSPVEGQAAAVVCEDVDGESTVVALSSEDIVAMWNEHYNAYYWYMYQLFVTEQTRELVGDDEGEMKGEEVEVKGEEVEVEVKVGEVEVKGGGVEEREQSESMELNHEEVSFSVLE